ncbi:hypothetical protein Hypma_009261 [Hypsizygus marmoreus]|uniref:MYND-type domain-containing protein n=1 Tax=Hypsizygus marmoreus TaxID=39966 RepID=A0A369JW74_HYPMA|nr:hypothetical protein Hypma_009261 [Hypsizygus marmoreus]
MNRRLGAEAAFGIGGGGLVSKKSQKNLEKAEDLCRKRKPQHALPYLMAAIHENPENLDAAIQFAFLGDRPSAVDVLEKAELAGRVILKERLGNDCFDDKSQHVGNFWSILVTRPYMRVLQALVRLYFEEGRFEESAKTMVEMLRLCPGDNMGQRKWLGSVLIRIDRYADALYFAQMWLMGTEKGDTPIRGGIAFSAPTKELLPLEREKLLSEWGEGSLLHTAALASFKLWGDCPQSRQYLKMAASAQPNILLKVLGLVSRPANLNMDPRSLNGPEEAHDYLWLTQDLWMEPDVWKWANENPDARDAVLKVCSRDACPVRETKVAQFKRCSSCHLVRYCSPACQKQDWATHKPDCKFEKQRKAAVRAFQTGKSLPKESQIPIYASDFPFAP